MNVFINTKHVGLCQKQSQQERDIYIINYR